jgi:Iron permease FTR1 family
VEGRAVLTALLIMLREGFEAALVVAIVYAYLRRIGRRDLVAPMWRGMAAAGALSVAAGVGVHLTVENLQGEPRLLAFAAVSLLAVGVLTWMIFWMRRQAHRIKGELEDSVDQAVAGRGDARLAVVVVLGGRRLPVRQFFTVTGLRRHVRLGPPPLDRAGRRLPAVPGHRRLAVPPRPQDRPRLGPGPHHQDAGRPVVPALAALVAFDHHRSMRVS